MIYWTVMAVLGLIAFGVIGWVGIIIYAAIATIFEKEPKPAKVTGSYDRRPARDKAPTRVDYGNGLRLGRYTAGVYGDALRQVDGGKKNIFSRLVITYADAQEDLTARTIDVQSYTLAATPDGEIVPFNLTAFCELRQAQRNFRADRILLAADGATGSDLADLLGALKTAPNTVSFDRKTAIVQNVTTGDVEMEYQFRAPNFKRVKVRPTQIGYTEQAIGNNRECCLLFIDGMIEGKDTPQRFKLDRIQATYSVDGGEEITNLAAFFLPKKPSRASVPLTVNH
ncbi:hypothetical protein [Acetobacter okinawensis]|uniref:hypothetical protein n=1 Tax=Acetobacter okinawensis TaxID=1076594 RepID=UPI0039E9C8CC